MGAVQILTHSMVQSIEENSVRKGYDPRDFALVADGGAGPLFAAQIALEVGTPCGARADVPGRHRGARACSRPTWSTSTSRPSTSASRSSTRRRSRRRSPSSRGRRAHQLDRRTASRPSDIVIQRVADCRYLGQGYELRVDCGAGAIDDAWVAQGARRLRRHPRARVLAPVRGVGRRDPEPARARNRAAAEARRRPRSRPGPESPAAALRHEGEAWFRVGGSLEQVATRFYDRGALKAGNRARGACDRQPVRLDDGHPARAHGARRPVREHRHRHSAAAAERRERQAGGGRDVSVADVRGRAQARGRRRASASRSTRSRCACSAARSTRSPRRWRASSSG